MQTAVLLAERCGKHRQARKVGRMLEGGGYLYAPGIRSADHHDPSVRPRKTCRPFDRVVTVERLVHKWVPCARRTESPAHSVSRRKVTNRAVRTSGRGRGKDIKGREHH